LVANSPHTATYSSQGSKQVTLTDRKLRLLTSRSFGTNNEKLLYEICLVNGIKTFSLIDSGAGGVFYAEDVAKKYNTPLIKNEKNILIEVADGRPFNLTHHVQLEIQFPINNQTKIACMNIRAEIAPIKHADLILGMPFLRQLNPIIDWRSGSISLSKDSVTGSCTILPIEPVKTVSITSLIPCLPYGSSNRPITPARRWSQPTLRLHPSILYSQSTDVKEDVEVQVETLSPLQFARLARRGAPVHLLIIQSQSTDNIRTTSYQGLPHLHPLAYNIVQDFPSVFTTASPPFPPERAGVDHKIEELPESKPVNRGVYRMSPAEQKALDDWLKEELEAGRIRPSSSSYGSPVLFVPKKNGNLRLCVDYRILNKQTIKNRYPLPRIDELLEKFSKAKFFTKIDLARGYNQIRMEENSIPKTAFKTSRGLFESLVMPFGLTNAPATFQALMNHILKPYINNFATVYLDDILIFSNSLEEHENHVRIIVETLQDHKLIANPEKCTFFTQEVEYLGHIIEPGAIKMDPSKVESILNWPILGSVHDVQVFMGLANYYRRFIKGFSKIAAPITLLLKHHQDWSWGEDQQKSFEELKASFSKAPLLRVYDAELTCRVSTDASDKALGGVLEQLFPDSNKWHPIAFESRKLIPAELNYPVHEKELLAIVHCLKVWRHYLEGQGHFKIYSDHCTLRYFQTQKDLSRRQARWSEVLSNYDFEIIYKPGSQNQVADSLSRIPLNLAKRFATLPGKCIDVSLEDYAALEEEELREQLWSLKYTSTGQPSTKVLESCDIITASISSDLLNQVKASLTNDPWFRKLQPYLEDRTIPRPPDINAQLHGICIKNGLVYKQERLFIPNDEIRTKIVQDRHDSALGGHFGQNKTEYSINREFFWPNMSQFIREYVASCDVCQRIKKPRHKSYGLLKPLPIPKKPWCSLSLDFVTGLPKTRNGEDAILVVVDRFSKMVHLFPCTTKATADQIAILFLRVIALHGIPEDMVSDRDPKFISIFWQSLWKRLGTKLKMSTSFHPQTDGQTERMNSVMEQVLRAYTAYDQLDWNELLPLVEFAMNNSVSSTTGHTPYFINYGYHPKLPSSINDQSLTTRSPFAVDFHLRLAQLQDEVSQRIREAQKRQKQYADENRKEYIFKKGDLVLLSTKNLPIRRPSKKLDYTYTGPFKIIEVVSTVAYKLELPDTWRIHNVFHVSLLEPYTTSDKFPSRITSPPPPEIIDGEEEFEVEKILDKRRNKGQTEYFVKWLGSPHHESTWEPAENLKHCEELVQQFDSSTSLASPSRSRRRYRHS
jgi:hypothetical protein